MAKKQFYPDKYHFTPAENRRFAWSNFTKLVHTNAHFEGARRPCHKRKRSWTTGALQVSQLKMF